MTILSVFDPPSVSSVSPLRVPFTGGSGIVISGVGFVPSNTITVRLSSAEWDYVDFVNGVVIDGSSITFDSPEVVLPGLELEGSEMTVQLAVAFDGQTFVQVPSEYNLVFYAKGVLSIGFIMVGPINDFGWTFAQNFGRMTLETVYGNQIETHYMESVPDGPDGFDDVLAAIAHLVADKADGGLGCHLVFTGSFSYLWQSKEAARRHPDKYIVSLAGFASPDDPPNIAYAWSMIYEMRYLAGLVAGRHTSRCVGYIAAYDAVPEVRRGLNAFAKGCREVNPECQVKVLWTSTWHDPWIEKQAAEEMYHTHGCDMIAQHSDTEEPQKVFAELGAVGVGYNSDMRVVVGDSVLTGPMLVWFPAFQHFVDAILTDGWVSGEEYFGYSADGGMTLAPYSPVVDYATRALVRVKWDELMAANGQETVFCGAMRTNQGGSPPPDQIGEDGCLKFAAIVGMDAATGWERPLMDWHWEGVEDLGYYTAPPDESRWCGEIHWTFSVGDCSADSESRVVTFSWLEPRECEGGLDLPAPVELDCDMVPVDSATGTVVVVLAALGVIVSLAFLAFVFVNRKRPVIRFAQKEFCYLFCLGSALASLALLAFLGDNTDTSCMLRPWLLHLSVTLMFGGLFVKIWRVSVIFNNKDLRRISITNRRLYFLMLKLLLADVGLLLLWTLMSPSIAVESVMLHPGVGEVNHVECETEESTVRLIAAIYKGGLIMYGVYLAFITRHVNSALSEAHYILLAIYNVAFVGGLMLLLKESLGVSAKSGLLLQAAGTAWCAVASLGCVFVPKYMRLDATDQECTANNNVGTGGRRSSFGDSTGGDGAVASTSYNNSSSSKKQTKNNKVGPTSTTSSSINNTSKRKKGTKNSDGQFSSGIMAPSEVVDDNSDM